MLLKKWLEKIIEILEINPDKKGFLFFTEKNPHFVRVDSSPLGQLLNQTFNKWHIFSFEIQSFIRKRINIVYGI